MSGTQPADRRHALGQINSTTYLRNQLLRDSERASIDQSVELRPPFVDAWLLRELRPLLRTFDRFSKARAPVRPLPEALISRSKTGPSIPTQQRLQQLGQTNDTRGRSRGWAGAVGRPYSEAIA
jgi:asparagine synthase (glutamine-hydrolysing)